MPGRTGPVETRARGQITLLDSLQRFQRSRRDRAIPVSPGNGAAAHLEPTVKAV